MTVLITGASSGIGRAAAEYFAQKGWNVAATMRSPEKETELTKFPNVKLYRMKNFVLYRYTELALVVIGLALIFLHREPNFWKGIGAGLFLQAGLMLLLDFFAEKRGAEYLRQLAGIS